MVQSLSTECEVRLAACSTEAQLEGELKLLVEKEVIPKVESLRAAMNSMALKTVAKTLTVSIGGSTILGALAGPVGVAGAALIGAVGGLVPAVEGKLDAGKAQKENPAAAYLLRLSDRAAPMSSVRGWGARIRRASLSQG